MRWLVVLASVAACGSGDSAPQPQTKEALGAALFDDPNLSEPAGQACSDCHVASAAFADPEDERTSAGVITDRFGPRNAPSAMYQRFAPPLHHKADGRMAGGLFWDGRANTLEQQALPPLLNPLEMNNPDKATVVAKVKARYGSAFKRIYGAQVFDDVDAAFEKVGDAIGAFERTPAFSPFSSRYDRYLAGTATLDASEQRGLAIFEDPARGDCASCHPSRPANGAAPLFTTFGYAALGVPAFKDNPFYLLPPTLNPDGESYIDRGLAATTGKPEHEGMFRIPSLRNVQRTTPYGHNGYFRRLDEMIEWKVRDHARPLSRQEIVDVVAFLGTLTDAEVEGAR